MNNSLKNLIVLTAFLFGATVFADTGWYQDFLTIDNGSGDASYWIGGDPGSGTQLDGWDFGDVSTLEITGADMKYWSDNQDRTGGSFWWEIDSNGFTEVIWSQTYLGGNDYQGTVSTSIDLLSGLAVGTSHTLKIYAKSWGTSQGDSYLSNSSANYVADFTVIPETSSLVMLGLTGLAAGLVLRKRKRA